MSEQSDFAAIVLAWIDKAPENARLLADAFDAAVGTTSRWTRGHSRPASLMVPKVIAWIRARDPEIRAKFAWADWTPDDIAMEVAKWPQFTIGDSGQSITCHGCGLKSWHPEDVKNKYCDKCHVFHERI